MAKIVGNLKELIEDAAVAHINDNVGLFKSTVPGPEGPTGAEGDIGVSVHHTKGTSTTDPYGEFSTPGEKDTYTMYGDGNETLVLGWFTVSNGDSAYTTAVRGGYAESEETFQASLSSLGDLVIEVEALAEATDSAVASVANKLGTGDITSVLTSEAEDKVLSALAGKTLKDQIDGVATETETTAELDARDITNRSTDNHTDGTTNGVYTLTERVKLAGVETGATADQTDAEIKTAYENNTDTNAYTDVEKTKLADTEISSQLDSRDVANRVRTNHTGTQSLDTVTETTSKKILTDVERTKLAGIEASAKDDQVASEVPVTANGNLSSNNVQLALQELQSDIDTINTINEW